MSVRVSELDGGLRVVTHRMETVETVSLGVWVHVGTRFEAAEVNGVSHLLEHMAFKGTERRNARAIAEEIEAVGGHLNAYTSREITAYHATVLKEDVALAVDIIADILQNPIFDETELGRERAVVLQEIGQTRDTPDDIVFDRFQETAFPDQPMGRPVPGCSTGGSGSGRSATRLYQCSGIRPSSSRNLTVSDICAAPPLDGKTCADNTTRSRAFQRLTAALQRVFHSTRNRSGPLRDPIGVKLRWEPVHPSTRPPTCLRRSGASASRRQAESRAMGFGREADEVVGEWADSVQTGNALIRV